MSDVYAPLERADELIASAFGLTDRQLDPSHRYLLYCDLLARSDHSLFGLDSRTSSEAIESALGSSKWKEYRRILSELRPIVDNVLAGTTYCVVSYWSPIDERRRSIAYRSSLTAEDRQRALAYAYSFYALTLEGRRFTPPLTSIVHFTSELATHKRGLSTSFLADGELTSGAGWLRIPPTLQGLPEQLGVAEAIESELCSLPIDKLRAALGSYLLNSPERPWEKLSRFPSRVLNTIRERMAGLSETSNEALEEIRRFLTTYFLENDPATALNREQVCVMVLTQILWQRACDECRTKLMYAFPAAVADTCCLLTVGTSEDLSSERRLAVSMLARSLFMHPLLSDYREREVQAFDSRQNNVFRRLLGHNFPKIFVKPGLNELTRIDRALSPHSGLSWAAEIVRRVSRLRVLFQHYESFVVSVMSSDRLREDFTRNVARFDLATEVIPRLRIVFEYLRDTLPSEMLQKDLKLEIDISDAFVIWGDQSFVTELLFNLLSNAVVSIDPRDVKASPERAVLRLSISLGAPYAEDQRYARISLIDAGRGFPRRRLVEHEGNVDSIVHSSRDGFWSNLNNVVEKAVHAHSSEGRFGVGLIFCVAYLRSLEWQDAIQRQGYLEIEPKEGEGTTVTMFLPGAVISSRPAHGEPG